MSRNWSTAPYFPAFHVCPEDFPGLSAQSAVEVKVMRSREFSLAIVVAQTVQVLCWPLRGWLTEDKGLLTSQALPLSEKILCRQRALVVLCATTAVSCHAFAVKTKYYS